MQLGGRHGLRSLDTWTLAINDNGQCNGSTVWASTTARGAPHLAVFAAWEMSSSAAEEQLRFLVHEMSVLKNEVETAQRARDQVIGDAKGIRVQLGRAAEDAQYLTTHVHDLDEQLRRSRASQR